MNQEEIDDWYEEQKQQLLNQYVKSLEEKKDHKKTEILFTNKLTKIHKQYEKLYKKYCKHKRIKKGTNKIISFMNKLSQMYR